VTDLRRIGDKLVSRERIQRIVDEILSLRQAGLSQQDVAARIGTDRTFVSRLETLGEVRKGQSIALVGFPVANKEDILKVAREQGVDFTFVLDERERWAFLEGKSGIELFAEVVDLFERLRGHAIVIILGHNRPARIMAALVERQAAVFHLPQAEGREAWFDPERLADLLQGLR
jgi:transcriptional regulator with XRE-family HTH domain